MAGLTKLAAAAALALTATSANAAPVKMRAAWIVPASNIPSIIFAKKELAHHLGQSYEFEPVRYQGTPAMVNAMAVGELEIGLLNFASLGIGVVNADMQDLRIVADEFRDGVPGHLSNEYFVRKDSGIKTPADLKGKVIAVNLTGSSIDLAMRVQLRKFGLEDKRDYSVIEAPFPTMKALLADKKADLIAVGAPFSLDQELRANSNVLFSQGDALGPNELGFWVMRDDFAKKNKAAVVDMLEDTVRATRWYLDPKNHDEAVKIAADFAKAPPALFQSWLFTDKDYYRDPNLRPDIPGTQRTADLAKEFGMIKGTYDAKKYVDLSYLEEALARLK
jgi:NitT/TauT family transport system substrate-binding protein